MCAKGKGNNDTFLKSICRVIKIKNEILSATTMFTSLRHGEWLHTEV